jgi:hypothetical protein
MNIGVSGRLARLGEDKNVHSHFCARIAGAGAGLSWEAPHGRIHTRDNLGIDAQGERNVVTYDDSNVVVGGAGDVNAPIGDSDTSAAVGAFVPPWAPSHRNATFTPVSCGNGIAIRG